MVALLSFAAVLGMAFLASALGRRLRNAKRQQTRPVTLHVVRDEPLDIREAQRRGR